MNEYSSAMSFLLLISGMTIAIIFTISTLIYARFGSIEIGFTEKINIDLIIYVGIYKVSAYYLLPLIMGIFSGFRYVYEDGIQLLLVLQIYQIEALSWVSWIAGFMLTGTLLKPKDQSRKLKEYNENTIKYFISLFVIFYICLINLNISNAINLENNIPLYVELFKSLIAYVGPPASILLLVYGFMKWGRLYGMLGLIGLSVSILVITTRGAIIYSTVFLIYLLFKNSLSRKSIIVSGLLISLLLSIYFISGGLPAIGIKIDSAELTLSNMSVDDKRGARTGIEEIEWRFGALSRMSTKFIEMYDRGDSAGINPILNSALGLLPRSINPDKPYPSTVRGDDPYSEGMYLLYREVYGYDTYSMVEFSSGGHAYWEFGWMGVILLSLISGSYIAFCAYYFQIFGIFSLALLIGIFKPWGYVDPKIWVSDIVMQIYQMILPLILIYFIMNIVGLKAKTKI